jgi:hypothetical protein
MLSEFQTIMHSMLKFWSISFHSFNASWRGKDAWKEIDVRRHIGRMKAFFVASKAGKSDGGEAARQVERNYCIRRCSRQGKTWQW